MRLLVLAIVAIFRPKALLIAENLCLRQQLIVLQRQHPRPRLHDADRRFWVLASRWFSDWRHPLLDHAGMLPIAFCDFSANRSIFSGARCRP